MKKPKPETCRFCKCVDERACILPDGTPCAWFNEDHTVCTHPLCMAAEQSRVYDGLLTGLVKLRGQEEWDSDEMSANTFLLACSTLLNADAVTLVFFTRLSRDLVETYITRAEAGSLIVDGEFQASYTGENASVSFMLDTEVLLGKMTRQQLPGQEVTYGLSVAGREYVERELLPEALEDDASGTKERVN